MNAGSKEQAKADPFDRDPLLLPILLRLLLLEFVATVLYTT